MAELRGEWAVVTGASSGLGVDFADVLAGKGANVVLTARREERLREQADLLRKRHGVEARVVPADLSVEAARVRLRDRLAEEGIRPIVLINNAGFGVWGRFADIPWERENRMLQLDVVAVAHLTKLFLPAMIERGRGYILQVASIGAYQPCPTYATYGAAKAFVLSFGEALAWELRGTGVHVTVLSPGVTRTEFLQVAGQQPTLYQRLSMMESRQVAEAGIRGMLRGKTTVVPGLINRLPIFLLRFTPRRAAAALAERMMTVG